MTETRKYCCTNRAPIEAVNVGTLDLILSIVAFTSTVVFMYYFRHKPEKFKTFSREFGTVQTFNNLEPERQNGVIIWLFVITILKILHESHLLISTISQNSFLVKVWLLACAPIEIGATTTAFWMAYYANEKLVFGCLALFYLLFRIYAIWIVKESMHEIISVGVGVSQLELDPKSPTEIKESSSSS